MTRLRVARTLCGLAGRALRATPEYDRSRLLASGLPGHVGAAEVLLRSERVVASTIECQIRGRCRAAAGVRVVMVDFEEARLGAPLAIYAHIRTAEAVAPADLAADAGCDVSPRLALAPCPRSFSAPARSLRCFPKRLVTAPVRNGNCIAGLEFAGFASTGTSGPTEGDFLFYVRR